MTRLNYTELEDGSLKSQELLLTDKAGYVIIYPDVLMYEVYNTGKYQPVKFGVANTLTKLKSKAKQAVIELGAKFKDEIRNRGETERFEVNE